MASKLLNLIALSSLAILACSFGATPVNALSVDSSVHARSLGHHNLVAKKKRAESRRCKPRPASTSTTTTVSTTSKAPTAPSTQPNPPPPPAPAPPPSTGGGGGKVGLAWNNGNQNNLGNFVTKKVGWTYTWGVSKPTLSDQLGLKFAPMLWGGDGGRIAAFQSVVKPGYGNAILGFNEPNHGDQANMSPGWAAQVWRDVIQPHGSSHKLVTPAVTSAPTGIDWLADFINQCGGSCRFDAVAVHWYGTSAQEFIDYLKKFHDRFQKPIWVTEFACQSFVGGGDASPAQVSAFMAEVTGFMDSTDWVETYFPFGLFPQPPGGVSAANSLMTPDFQPNALGWQVIG